MLHGVGFLRSRREPTWRECRREIEEIFKRFDGRKVTHGHFVLGYAPPKADGTGNSHGCLRIVAVDSAVFHPMWPHIKKLVFSAERQPGGKYRLWQYFRDQAPCDPFSIGEYSTADELKAGLEQALSFM
jgi:hypothetical protein